MKGITLNHWKTASTDIILSTAKTNSSKKHDCYSCFNGAYMRPEMKFYFAMEKIMFTFFLITGEIKCNLISEEVEVKWPIKKFKQTRV